MSEQEAIGFALEEEIERFSGNIKLYHKALNDEGVWLFLASLGCWSVVGGGYQALSLATTFLLFLWRINEKRIEKISFQMS